MLGEETSDRDLARLVVPRVGRLADTDDPVEPCHLVDAQGGVVEPVMVYFRELQAAGRSAATLRSYGMDLLRWFRFLWAAGVAWDQATRVEAREFSRRLQLLDKPGTRSASRTQSEPNPITGKVRPGPKYAPTTRAHSETVLRSFYDCHLDLGTGSLVNPLPKVRAQRANAHHNPMEPYRRQRVGLFRPRVPQRVPRSIPDERYNELFAALSCNRDRALVAFYVSTAARASELLGARQCDPDPGQQVISVVRKGTRAVQQLPASPDAFVWLRLYQHELQGRIPKGKLQPLWWTLRGRPLRPLTYHAALAALKRAQELLGTDYTWHDIRHTAAYRMAQDPDMPLTDVQWVLGHANLTSTQIYTNPRPGDVIEAALAHHARLAGQAKQAPAPPPPAPGYRPESMRVLFGQDWPAS